MSDQEATRPEPLQEPWAYYQRKGLSEMRPYVPGEDMGRISVSAPDMDMLNRALEHDADPGGYIARNPQNHADQWYVAQAYFDDNLEPVVKRDDKVELVKALRKIAKDAPAEPPDTYAEDKAYEAWENGYNSAHYDYGRIAHAALATVGEGE